MGLVSRRHILDLLLHVFEVALLPLGLGEGHSLLLLLVLIPFHCEDYDYHKDEGNHNPDGDVLLLLFFGLLLLAILVKFFFRAHVILLRGPHVVDADHDVIVLKVKGGVEVLKEG